MIPLRDTIPSRHYPVMTWTIIAANVGVFCLEMLLPPQGLDNLVFVFGIVPARERALQRLPGAVHLVAAYLPYLTHMFLHGGLLHLISNMWALWVFGDNVEDRMGPRRFLFFYLLCGVIAGMAQTFFYQDARVPMLGASGAIAGVLGAYLIMYPRAQVVVLLPVLFLPLFFLVPAVVFLLMWFFIQLFSGTLSLMERGPAGGIAWWAHVAGFLAGMVLWPLFARRRDLPRRPMPDEFGIRGAWTRW